MHEIINLGTLENPKNVNISIIMSREEMNSYLKLFRQYQDVFMWSYRYLKTYDTCIIQHIIPLNPKLNPFQQKI
jgi:hypothetical protein